MRHLRLGKKRSRALIGSNVFEIDVERRRRWKLERKWYYARQEGTFVGPVTLSA